MTITRTRTHDPALRDLPLQIAGFDPGNNTTILADATGALQFSSYLGVGNLADVLASRRGSGGDAALRPGEYALEYQGITSFVGDLAVRQVRDATTARGDTGRYVNGHTLKLLLAAVGAHYRRSVRLRIVTGVPAKVFKDQPDIKERISAAFVGAHRIMFHDQHGSVPLTIVIEAVVVQMEGVVALAALGERGKPVGIADIGGGSTDIGWFDVDGRVVDHRVGSLPKGVDHVGELLSRQFRAAQGRDLTLLERDMILRNYLAGLPTTIYHKGEHALGISHIRSAIQTIGADITSFIAKHWALGEDGSVGADGAYVLFIGGGAYFFSLALDTDVRIPPEPEKANAVAYHTMAERVHARGKWPLRQE